MRIPFPLMVDAYQASHYNQIPSGMENFQCSQLVHRKSITPGDHRIVSAGVFPFVQWLKEVRVTQEDIQEADEFYKTFSASVREPYYKPYPWPKEMFQTIVDKYNGKIPITVQALVDGSVHYVGEPSVQVFTDEPGMGELVGWIESQLVPYMWQCSVVATRGRLRKDKFFNFYRKLYTSRTVGEIYNMFTYKFHDFGRRGAANSVLTGYAHLINWPGTDIIDSAYLISKMFGTYLRGDAPYRPCSIPAAAHRTITPWATEYEAYDNIINIYGDDLVSIVADSYDYENGLQYLAKQHTHIKGKGGVLVVRPDCYDQDTEILTEFGWKLFSDIDTTTHVAQYNEDKTINFTKPTKYVNEPYDGLMYHFTNQIGKIDLLVTPNHRMIKRKASNGEIVVQSAEDVKYYCEYTHESSGFLSNVDCKPLSDYERLLIAFQADGSYESGELDRKTKLNDYYRIRFNFTKQRKVDRLIQILVNGRINFKVSYENSRPQNTQIYVDVPTLPSKTFDWVDISNVNSDWCRDFVEELSYWDATRREDYRFKYTSGNKLNTDVIQAICALGGIKSKYTLEPDDRSDKYNDMHTLHMTTNKTGSDTQSIQTEKIQYNGNVYCVQVPSGMIIVRRNNCVSISGNSGDPVDCVIRGLHVLDANFGSTINEAGLKTINSAAIIQGDGVDDDIIFNKILPAVVIENFCPSNVAFGMGENNHIAKRSDLETAYKTCAIGHDGDDGYSYLPVMKASNSQFKTSCPCPVSVGGNSVYRVNPIDRDDLKFGKTEDLKTLYSNGIDYIKNYNFEDCVKNAIKQWNVMPPENINSISPIILKLQEEYMKEKGSVK